MKKSERLNQELLYLTDKKIFHLKELEEKFAISERTALRDITDLEQLGLAFYSETGRSGGYHITNSNEYQKIQTKLLKNLPQKLQNQISLQKEFVHYISQPSLNEVPFLLCYLKLVWIIA